MKKFIPINIKLYLKYLLSSSTIKEYSCFKGKKKVIVTLGADYGNLGDVAITYAQKEYLKNKYPDYEVIELPISKTFTHLKALKKVCSSEDIITTIGGGNMGDLYGDLEYSRQFIIKKFPKNKIISFPQTIDFSETKEGNKKLKRAIKVYSHHKNLTIVARENLSYEIMKKVYSKNNVVLSPDIVMSLNMIDPQFEREGITICLRDDKEKLIDSKKQSELISKLENTYSNVQYYDTHIGINHIKDPQREEELLKIWMAFKKSKVVITDRLHGMIFCYITKTPCVVLPNNNHKVKGCFDWIKDCGYIKLCEHNNTNQIIDSIKKMYSLKEEEKREVNLNPHFKF